MPDKSISTGSKMSSNKCSCCPYGYHIDRDFVRYCDSLYNNAQLDKLRQHKRERRKEKMSVESYLGLSNFPFDQNQNYSSSMAHQNLMSLQSENLTQKFCLQSDDLKNAMNDFEDTWRKSSNNHNVVDNKYVIKQSDNIFASPCTAFYNSLPSANSEDMKESKLLSLHALRSSSTNSLLSHSAIQSHIGLTTVPDESCSSFVSGFNASFSSASKSSNNTIPQTVGINKLVLRNIREQMASSLNRMKELEEQVKAIPLLKIKIFNLFEEKKTLMNELKLKNTSVYKMNSKAENELEKQLKKLENEGIMSPTLSRKCLSSQHQLHGLYSPAIASSLDSAMIKKHFIEEEIISHMKMNDARNFVDKLKSKKNVGTSCIVLTRDIGIGYVPNMYKSIAVGNNFSQKDSSNLLRKAQFDEIPNISSESVESDSNSSNCTGGTLNFFPECNCTQSLPNETSVYQTFVDSSTNTEVSHIDKCMNTEREVSIFTKNDNFPEKVLKHKSVYVSPSMSNKYIQVSNKQSLRNVGLQTSKDSQFLAQSSKHDIGVGDFIINDVTCNNCKKCKKSIGIGDSDINAITCKYCKFKDAFINSFESVNVGDFDISASFCKKCQKKIEILLNSKNLSKCSTGTNTTSDLSISSRNMHICDKCSKTIHSVAQDLVADSKKTFKPKPILQLQACQLSNLKSEIQSLKIESNYTSKSESVGKCIKYDKEISQGERYKYENVIKRKDDSQIGNDTTEESLSHESLPNFTNLLSLPRKKNELSKEIKAACKVLNDHLQKFDRANEKKMLSSLVLIQTEWFKTANQKKANPLLIEDYLDAFEEFSKLLLHKIVNLSDSNGNTALHYAVSYGNFDVVSILIDSKVCDVNLKNKAGYTSIMLVALAEMKNDTHHYVVQRLFNIGDINAKATQNGQTALMLAVSHAKKEIVKILLDVGAEINLQDKDGSTALMCAAEHGHLDIAKILLSHPECDPKVVDNDGCTALTIAMEAGHKDIGLLIYTNMNFSRGSSPFSTLKARKRSTPRSTPPPHTPTIRTPPLRSPATKSMNSLTSFHFPS